MTLPKHLEQAAWCKNYHHCILRTVIYLMLVSSSDLGKARVEAATVARVTPAGDAIELEYTGTEGVTFKEEIPIHRAGNIRYFSAGIGMEQREAAYPSFPL